MNFKDILPVLMLVLTSTSSFAHGEHGASMFSPEEFAAVTTAAIAEFKIDNPEFVDDFYGISLNRNIQDNVEVGVLVKVYVKESEAGSPTVKSKYNCHKHETIAIECHPQ